MHMLHNILFFMELHKILALENFDYLYIHLLKYSYHLPQILVIDSM